MQIHKITVSQAVELFKKKDLWAKIALTVLFLSYLSFCRACFFNPIAGDTYPVYENNYPGDLFGFRAKNKGAKQCKLDGKKIFLERETQTFWYDFFVETNAFYVWHLQYQDVDNVKKNILTYRFVIDGGVAGGGSLGPDIGIDERQDSIVIFYDAEPFDGFTIEPSPFSDKIVIQKSAPGKDVISAHCAMEWFN